MKHELYVYMCVTLKAADVMEILGYYFVAEKPQSEPHKKIYTPSCFLGTKPVGVRIHFFLFGGTAIGFLDKLRAWTQNCNGFSSSAKNMC